MANLRLPTCTTSRLTTTELKRFVADLLAVQFYTTLLDHAQGFCRTGGQSRLFEHLGNEQSFFFSYAAFSPAYRPGSRRA